MVGFDSSGKALDGRFVDGPLKVIILDVGFVEMFVGVLKWVCSNELHQLKLSINPIGNIELNEDQFYSCAVSASCHFSQSAMQGKGEPLPRN